MATQKQGKLNHLHTLLDEGLLAPAWWLEEQGYSRALLAKYVGRWLASPTRGVYRRPGPPLKWQHVVASLQLLARSSLHIGGRTALVHRGFGHYVQMRGGETILLYGPDALPAWVNKLGLNDQFRVRSGALFPELHVRRNADGAMVDAHDQPVSPQQLAAMGLTTYAWGAWDWPLCYSSDERAIFEVLQDVPSHEAVYEADVLMQGLVNLRPDRLMSLLRACRNVKVKRLFLALAARHGHAWFKHIDEGQLDLGKGKRMLVPGGRLHPRYLITLPSDLDVHAV